MEQFKLLNIDLLLICFSNIFTICQFMAVIGFSNYKSKNKEGILEIERYL